MTVWRLLRSNMADDRGPTASHKTTHTLTQTHTCPHLTLPIYYCASSFHLYSFLLPRYFLIFVSPSISPAFTSQFYHLPHAFPLPHTYKSLPPSHYHPHTTLHQTFFHSISPPARLNPLLPTSHLQTLSCIITTERQTREMGDED